MFSLEFIAHVFGIHQFKLFALRQSLCTVAMNVYAGTYWQAWAVRLNNKTNYIELFQHHIFIRQFIAFRTRIWMQNVGQTLCLVSVTLDSVSANQSKIHDNEAH